MRVKEQGHAPARLESGRIVRFAGTARVRYHLGKGKPHIEVIEASADEPVRTIDGPTLLAWCADE